MTDQTIDKLVELKNKRNNYKDFLEDLRYQIRCKKYEDTKIQERIKKGSTGYVGEFFLKFFASIGLFKDPQTGKDMVRVAPHYECNHGCCLEADEDLLNLIMDWVEQKLAEVNTQIDTVALEGDKDAVE